MIDWKSFLPIFSKWLVGVILTVIATKWADSAAVVQKLLAGDTVSLYNGAINLSVSQIQLWLTTGIIALVGAVLGWIQRIKAKQQTNIALQLPKGATHNDVARVADASPTLSTTPNPSVLKEVARSVV